MIWAGEHYVCMGIEQVQGTYTCCAEQHCCQHFGKSLALKVLHMSVSMPPIGEPHTYDLALDGLAHLFKHLFRHGGAGEMSWRLAGDGRVVIRTACCLALLVWCSRCNPAPWLFCGSSTVDVAAIKGTPRSLQGSSAARSPQPPSEDCNWAALDWEHEHDTPRDDHACEVPSAAPSLKARQSATRTNLIQITIRVRDCAAV